MPPDLTPRPTAVQSALRASDSAVLAVMDIDAIEQIGEHDAIALLHAIEFAVRRSGQTHIERWRYVASDLERLQLYLVDELDDDKVSDWGAL